jgi:hypothetical protein
MYSRHGHRVATRARVDAYAAAMHVAIGIMSTTMAFDV